VGADGSERLPHALTGALTAIRRELAAIVVVAAVGAPLVMLWLDGARELVVLAGYGLGAILWIHARVRGVRLAARRARCRRGDVDGP